MIGSSFHDLQKRGESLPAERWVSRKEQPLLDAEPLDLMTSFGRSIHIRPLLPFSSSTLLFVL